MQLSNNICFIFVTTLKVSRKLPGTTGALDKCQCYIKKPQAASKQTRIILWVGDADQRVSVPLNKQTMKLIGLNSRWIKSLQNQPIVSRSLVRALHFNEAVGGSNECVTTA